MSVLAEQIETARTATSMGVAGCVTAVTGMAVEAAGLPLPVGSLCRIETSVVGRGGGVAGFDGHVLAEVIGFRGAVTMLMPLADAGGVARGHRVRLVTAAQKTVVGPNLLGRVVDGMGRTCDGGPEVSADVYYPLHCTAPDSMRRARITQPLSVGIRSINGLLTPGAGGRLGVFAGTGVGKSILLSMMARYTSADVTVIGLVGERGREVKEFIDKGLGDEGRKRSVVVASTSDQSPALRVRAGFVATAIAEYFRDLGANVLLLMDSVTRIAMAARQIGLAAGEPPATKGYPPSVFALLPRLLERSGRTEKGSITGLYTVLVEGDDQNDPIADAVRGILDGHIWLSRRLASRGQYPAVSVLDSVSRLMPDVVDAGQMSAAGKIRRLLSIWDDIEDLVNIGAYASGTNAEYDLAIRMRPAIEAFLKQGMHDRVDFETANAALAALVGQMETGKGKLKVES